MKPVSVETMSKRPFVDMPSQKCDTFLSSIFCKEVLLYTSNLNLVLKPMPALKVFGGVEPNVAESFRVKTSRKQDHRSEEVGRNLQCQDRDM